jgi:hypothetical protein
VASTSDLRDDHLVTTHRLELQPEAFPPADEATAEILRRRWA